MNHVTCTLAADAIVPLIRAIAVEWDDGMMVPRDAAGLTRPPYKRGGVYGSVNGSEDVQVAERLSGV